VLKRTGSFYLNLGDTYCGGGRQYGSNVSLGKHALRKAAGGSAMDSIRQLDDSPQAKIAGASNWLQTKQLLLIPSRTAIALQEDGWILRNDIVWSKPNAMPSSVKDRLACRWEHVFHFVKNRKYFYDLNSIRETHKTAQELFTRQTKPFGKKGSPSYRNAPVEQSYSGKFDSFGLESEKYGSPRARTQRNKEPYQANNPHTMRLDAQSYIALNKDRPSDLSHPLGKNPGDVFRDKTLDESFKTPGTMRQAPEPGEPNAFNPLGKNPGDFWEINTQPFSDYWCPNCHNFVKPRNMKCRVCGTKVLSHFACFPEDLCVKPILSSCPPDGLVFDPMCGKGTALLVAKRLGRRYIGIEIVKAYCEMAQKILAMEPFKIEKFQEEEALS